MNDWIISDGNAEAMQGLCDLRATFEQRTGGLTTLERLTRRRGCPPTGFTCDDDGRAALISERTGLPRIVGEGLSDGPATPWEVLDQLPQLLEADLAEAPELGCNCGASVAGDHRVDVDPIAIIFPGVVFDATGGAIRVEQGAVIRPNAVLCGPCWIGEGSTVVDAAHIKACTSIGPSCKVGGEVGGTIMQAFSNKAHPGHIGDSIIGEWVNIGAGTSNSNLLNTYGEVVVKGLDGQRHRTGRQFVGSFIGDHAKFAIETRIMTGTVIGTGAMVASTTPPPTPTPRFQWCTDASPRAYRIEKFLDVARTVMARRDRELGSAAESKLRALAE